MNKELKDFIKNDILYKNMFDYYKNHPNFTEIVKKSGLIKEPLTKIDKILIEDNKLLTMPINKPKTNKKLALIISTGSYSPLHEGHVEKMLLTKEYVESMNYEVLQGVISLSHDAYVAFKNNGISKNHISNRTMLAYEKIEEMNQSDWLKVDRFEGEAVSCAINFSTVIKRLLSLVENYLQKDITVFYVYGSDNIGFSNAFINQKKIHGVCIEREGFKNKEYLENIKNDNLHYISSEKSLYSSYSSTKIRGNRENVYLTNPIRKDKKPVYLIRGNSVPDKFNTLLKNIFKKYLDEKIEVRIYSTQTEYLNNFISLDKFIKGDINIEASRIFEVSSFQKKANDMIFFNEQKISFSPGIYNLIDDDSVSGYTIKKVTEFLKSKNISICNVQTIVDKYINEDEYLYDVVDSRDFYLNGFKSGLMIEHPNDGVKRVPYIFPYVNLTTRANIKSDNQIAFSKEIVELNHLLNKEGSILFNTDYLLDMYNNFLSTEIK